MAESIQKPDGEAMSFWAHLDVLRGVLLRCLAAWAVCSVAAFCFKDALFGFVFAPAQDDFCLYRLLGSWGMDIEPLHISFINTELAAQFTTHLEVAAWAGLVLCMPYIIYLLYGFIAPALYSSEKRHVITALTAGTACFAAGVVFCYFVIFPLSVRFLASYQVYHAVANMISLKSYIGTFVVLGIWLGVLFELPVFTYALGRLGVINAGILRRYRRHAVVVIMIIAAVITPTSDIFTLAIVTIPVYALYELSIFTVK